MTSQVHLGYLPYAPLSFDGITSTSLTTEPKSVLQGSLTAKDIAWQGRLKTGTTGSETLQLQGRVHPDCDFVNIGSAVALPSSNAWTTIQLQLDVPVAQIRFVGANLAGGEEAEARVLAVN